MMAKLFLMRISSSLLILLVTNRGTFPLYNSYAFLLVVEVIHLFKSIFSIDGENNPLGLIS